jgi:AraC-like DNA-binding protein
MSAADNATLWSVAALDGLRLLRATIVEYAFKRHMHDYFVIGMVEAGVQTFAYGRDRFVTQPGGIIILNPGEPHTGEAANAEGFHYRALYPEADTLQEIAADVRGRTGDIPFFARPVLHDPALFAHLRHLHAALEAGVPSLQAESEYRWTVAQIILRHADARLMPRKLHRERHEVARLRAYIDDHYAEDISLNLLARLVHWSPFYLLSVFRAETGLPPHAYLDSVRVPKAQQYLRQGEPLSAVSLAVGYNDQSHFTNVFKRLIGVTPGHYAKQVNFLQDR